MYYKIIQPSRELRPFIKYYWILKDHDPGFMGTHDLLIPDGCTEIIFNNNSVYGRSGVDSRDENTVTKGCVIGQRNRSILARRLGFTDLVGVKFATGALNLLLNIPESEFRNQSVELAHLDEPWLTELEEKVFEHTHEEDTRILLNRVFEEKLLSHYNADLVMVRSISRNISQSMEFLPLSDIHKAYNIHSKKLERLFNQYVGLSPKNFSRVMRFKKTYKLLNRNKTSFYDSSFYDLGFYDQNHFIKDFQFFTNQSPSDYYKQKSEISDDVLLQTLEQLKRKS